MQLTTNLLSLALVAASTWAAPLVSRQDELQLYQLQVSSPGHTIIDGEYLVANGSTMGLMIGAQPPVQVYTAASSKKGLLELHTYPVGIVDHAVGLHGPPGLMEMVDLANPHQQEKEEDGLVREWDEFRIEGDKLLNDGEGKWYAFVTTAGYWLVKWYEGTVGITDDYLPIEITMKEVGTGNYNGGVLN